MPATITLPVGRVLVLNGSDGGRAALWRLPDSPYGKRSIHTALTAGQVTLGPYPQTRTFKLIVDAGDFESVTQDALVAELERTTDRIRSATVIAKALNEGKKAMSVLEKFKHLAERSKAVPTVLGDRADKAIARWDAVEKRGHGAIDNLDVVIDQAEQSAAVMEDALNQLSNGGPPLSDSDAQ
jgi:hypothetical protein